MRLIRDAKGRDDASIAGSLVTCAGVPLNLPEPPLNNFPHRIFSVISSLKGRLYLDSKTGVIRSMDCDHTFFSGEMSMDAPDSVPR
jgi:hypothetical protein